MNKDIRISISFLHHRKRAKLKALLGPGSTDCLLNLWLNAAMHRSDGVLSGMDEFDIAFDAGWDGEPEAFVGGLLRSGFLDRGEDGTYILHDWADHQGYAVHARERSEQARHAAEARWKKKHAGGIADSCSGHADSVDNMRVAEPGFGSGNPPIPSPKPNPEPKPDPMPEPLPDPKPNPEPWPVPLPEPAPSGKEAKAYPLNPPEGDRPASDGDVSENDGLFEESALYRGSCSLVGDQEEKSVSLSKDGCASTPFGDIESRPAQRDFAENVPYDKWALRVIYELIDYCEHYIPDAPKEIGLLQELAREYPTVDLAAEFRKARDWLQSAPLAKRPRDLRRFLRRWVSNAYNKYDVGKPRVIGYETEVVFVPAADLER